MALTCGVSQAAGSGAVSQDLELPPNQASNRSYASTVLVGSNLVTVRCSASVKQLKGLTQLDLRKSNQAVSTKIDQIRRSSSSSNPYCFKCGDKGHQAISCRNVVVCFRYRILGHRSYNCRVTMLRSANQSVREEGHWRSVEIS